MLRASMEGSRERCSYQGKGEADEGWPVMSSAGPEFF